MCESASEREKRERTVEEAARALTVELRDLRTRLRSRRSMERLLNDEVLEWMETISGVVERVAQVIELLDARTRGHEREIS